MASPGRAENDSEPRPRIELAYNIYLGGFLAGTVDLTVEADGKHYRINSAFRSHGVLDFLIGFKRQNDVLGEIADRTVKPTKYAASGVWGGEARSVLINYTAASGLRFTARPSAFEDKREPVPSHLLPGTKDPFSALYQAILRYHDGNECDGSSKVFDGRRRYDILFEAIAGGPVAGPLYSGTAQICRLRQIPIAGFSQRTWLPRLMRPEWTDIWMAKVRDDLPVLPARLEADAGLGAMVAHLVAIGGRKHPPGAGPSENDLADAVSKANALH
ncbi:MAG: DUF3108 domain-containing protein [Proteobacteria bacterium]|nr:DUF3108 domain-containing protein [Pseudomonadota bacterium]